MRARAYAERVLRVTPCADLTLMLRLALPAIYLSREALLDERRSYAAVLEISPVPSCRSPILWPSR